MNYMKIIKSSVADGAGVRVALYVSGCSLHCRKCFNPESWNFKAGKPFDSKAKRELFDALDKPYIQGITISGGHGLEDENVIEIFDLICEIRACFPDKDIWLYTGLNFENIQLYSDIDYLLNPDTILDYYRWLAVSECDILVDGKYIEEEKDITLRFRGSRNQRIIDIRKTLEQGEIVLYCD